MNSILNQETGPWTTNGIRRKSETASKPLFSSMLEEEEGRVCAIEDFSMVERFIGGLGSDGIAQTRKLLSLFIFSGLSV